VSEDIYTSIVLHNDVDRRWKAVMHPGMESKMLSPQDLLS
jgi:cellulose synthase (UDP-forming)